MKPKTKLTEKKKLNLYSLISLLTILVPLISLFIPWSRLFLLRDDLLSSLYLIIIIMAVSGVFMLVTGVIGLVRAKKRSDQFTGTWMSIAGLMLGLAIFGYSSFVIISYLVTPK
jgi:uncharacterized BrkB/YihY/UPF0761 family membrane protein